MSRVEQALDRLIEEVARRRNEFSDRHLAAFCAMPGRKWAGDLLVVGRAPNGWLRAWEPEEAADPARRAALVRSTAAYSLERPGALIDKVCFDLDKGAPSYPWRRSPFWAVTREVVGALCPDVVDGAGDDRWSDAVLWSNLYKVSRHHANRGEAGVTTLNPSEALKAVQRDRAAQLLALEIEEWRPSRILFMTGFAWARPFLAALGASPSGALGTFVEAAGHLSTACGGVPFVVTVRPERRPRKPFVREVLACFRTIDRRGGA